MPNQAITDPPPIDLPETIPPQHRRILLETLSDHFALGTATCRRRACRRAGACRGGGHGADERPACIDNLPAVDSAEIGHVVTILADIHAGSIWLTPATGEPQRWRQDQAIAIMQAALARMPGHRAHFRRWHNRFKAPSIDTAKFLMEARAELAHAEVTLGLLEMKEKMRR